MKECTYTIIKTNWNNGEVLANYGGGYDEKDVKRIIHGFKLFSSNTHSAHFDRKNSLIMYTVSKEPRCFSDDMKNVKAFWEK